MILGIGIDLVEVDRITRSLLKGDGFKNLVFSEEEQQLCEQKTKPFESYAARFAAKEAFLKALGTGLANGNVALNEIEITHDTNGKPTFHLLGKSAQWADEQGIGTILVSLSHLKTVASAVVIIEKQ